jgi:hypothetical protein
VPSKKYEEVEERDFRFAPGRFHQLLVGDRFGWNLSLNHRIGLTFHVNYYGTPKRTIRAG